MLRGDANKHSCVCHNLGSTLRAGFDPTPAPSLSGLSPTCNPNRLVSISEEDPSGPSVGGVSRFTKSRWFVLKLLLCPQGEQGEDGKAEGPPGPPGDPVSTPSNFHPLDPGLLLCGEGEAEQG